MTKTKKCQNLSKKYARSWTYRFDQHENNGVMLFDRAIQFDVIVNYLMRGKYNVTLEFNVFSMTEDLLYTKLCTLCLPTNIS